MTGINEVRPPRTIGLTGGIGTGKSAVAEILAKHGFRLISADKIGHSVLMPDGPAYSRVIAEFGEGILSSDGTIDRKQLGAIVFADKSRLQLLNSLTHPHIGRLVEEELLKPGRAVLEAAILCEMGLAPMVDQVWLVTAPLELRVERVMKRDSAPIERVMDRIRSQTDDEYRLRFADVIIENDCPMAELEDRVKRHLDIWFGDTEVS